MRQTVRPYAAKIRPTLRVFFASLLFLSVFPRIASADNNTPERRQTAKTQFDRAERNVREALKLPPANRDAQADRLLGLILKKKLSGGETAATEP